jgi:hypothetical protein
MRKTMRFGACAAALLSALSVASYGVTLGSDKFVSRTNTATHTQSARIGNQFLRSGSGAADFLMQNDVKGTAPMATPFNSLARVDSAIGAVKDAPVDFDGDGKTDYVITRNTGGSPGQLVWYYAQNGGTNTAAVSWGLSTDWVLSEDFDGDGKDDYVIWRPAPAGQAAFYMLLSATGTVRTVVFGQEGDVPSVIGDYDGDNIADIAVYRPGATDGAQSYWYYIGSLNNPSGAATVVAWGIRNDILAPGDYDGDGKNDFAIARNDGTGHLNFWRLTATGTVLPVVNFGTTADLVTPGDYDGDGKTDIATTRTINGQYQWQYLASSNGTVNYAVWGASGDLPAQGDYDGDGRTDIAIYRRSTTAGQSAFWALRSSDGGTQVFSWGQSGDFAVADANVF